MTDERFQVLVEKYLEGRLTDEEARELLEAPAPLRDRLFDEVSMANLLARAEGKPHEELVPRIQAALREKSDKDAMVARIIGRLPEEGRRAAHRPAVFLALAASLVIAAGLVYVLTRPEPAAPPVADLPLRPEFKLAPEVEEAVRRGVAYLKKTKLPTGQWQPPLPSDELVLLAFLHAGVSQEDPLFQKLLGQVLAAKLQRVYSVSLQAMVLEKLDRVKHKDRIAECARFLIDNQCRNGQWAYGKPYLASDPPFQRADAKGVGAANNSCSMFAAMGLRACSDAGIAIPPQTLALAAQGWRECQRADKDTIFGKERAGWCYSREETPHHPYGSMSAGGLAALVTFDRLLGQDWRQDRAAQAGLNWVTHHFTVIENPGPVEELMAKEMISDTPNPNTELYFWFWALERAAAVCGLPKFGERDWYAEVVAEMLMLQQRDGSWSSGVRRCQPAWDTCYAILFLTKSTRPFPEAK